MASAEQFRCDRSTPVGKFPAAAAAAAGPSAAAGSAAPFALPSGQHLPRGSGTNRDANVPGRNQPAKDLRRHPGHVPEDVKQPQGLCSFKIC